MGTGENEVPAVQPAQGEEEPAAVPAVVLPDAARQRVVALAADVVGRLPVDQVPASLRPFARFTPARRLRHGAAVLGAALDGDDAFRRAVAEVVETSLPDLARAVREGGSTAASDPVDVAVVAYLLRPAGWEQAVAAAAAGAADAGGADRDELVRLRAECDRLRAAARTAAKDEEVRLRDAVARATADAAAELAALERRVRDRTRELRAAERARDEAVAALEQAQQAAGPGAEAERRAEQEAARRAELEAEARLLRERVAELERGADGARRDGRAERGLDDARLWLLVDTLTEAAAGIRRELALPPPARRPADGVQPGAASPAAGALRSADDAGALDRLLALPNVHLVVDGYNVTKSGYGDLTLADQRARLIGALAALAARTGAEVTIAFDGGARPPVQPAAPRGVRVLFSAAGEIADDLIRRLVAAEPEGRPVVVVTSDQQVVTDVRRAGAWVAPSAVLLARLG